MENPITKSLKVLEDNFYYKLLNMYAVKNNHPSEVIRNKAWFTGSINDSEKGHHIDTLVLHFLFESKKTSFYIDPNTCEPKELKGLIVKDAFIIKGENIEEQVIEKYESFFHSVMDSHFNK